MYVDDVLTGYLQQNLNRGNLNREAPLKSIYRPWLELCSAYLASELLKTIIDDI